MHVIFRLRKCVWANAAARRYEAAEWLRQMDHGAPAVLPKEPTEEEFCLALRNGLILCNVLNKVNPGAVHKVPSMILPAYELKVCHFADFVIK